MSVETLNPTEEDNQIQYFMPYEICDSFIVFCVPLRGFCVLCSLFGGLGIRVANHKSASFARLYIMVLFCFYFCDTVGVTTF